MSMLDAVAARVTQIQTSLADIGSPTPSTDGSQFDTTLSQVQAASAASATATTDTGPAPATSPATTGATLPSGVTGSDIVADAQQYLGVPYVFGGDSSAGMDCSGLVQKVLGDLGMPGVTHLVSAESTLGTAVPSLADAQPGDLIVEKGNAHIQIYAGDGQVIEAPREGENVVQRTEWLDPGDISTIRRVTAPPSDAAPALTAPPTGSTAPDGGTLTPAEIAQLTASGVDLGSLMQYLAPSSPTSAAGIGIAGATASTSIPATATAAGPSTSNTALSSALLDPATSSATMSALSQLTALDAVSGDSSASTGSSDGGSGSSADQLSSVLASLAGQSGVTGTTDAAFAQAASSVGGAGADTLSAAQSLAQSLSSQLTAPIITVAGQGQGAHAITVNVVPEQLGPITVQAHMTDQGLRIELSSPTAAGRDALGGMMTELRRDLAGAGIDANVGLAASSSGTAAEQQAAAGQQGQQALFDLLSQSQSQSPSGFAGQQPQPGPAAQPVRVAKPAAVPPAPSGYTPLSALDVLA